MAGHQIVHSTKGMSQGHTHVERVELEDGRQLTVSEVVSSMLNGHSYFTINRSSGARNDVQPYRCPECDHWGIRYRTSVSTT